jgi:NTP pyrophosphatase (non-canonical NTP hydrolase)
MNYSSDNINEYGRWVEGHWFPRSGPNPTEDLGYEELRNLFIMTTGLAGESGEVCEKLKKYVRDNNGPNVFDYAGLQKELGDALFYLCRIIRFFGWDPSEIIEANVQKLEDRTSRGTLQGSGDNR